MEQSPRAEAWCSEATYLAQKEGVLAQKKTQQNPSSGTKYYVFYEISQKYVYPNYALFTMKFSCDDFDLSPANT